MKKPNILIIVTDQQRADTVGAYGSKICRTPNMDRLAAQGMCFDQAFTPTGLCSPVRCSFLSGVYPHEHKVLTNISLHPVREELDPKNDQMSAATKAAGYQMGYVGKWHVSEKGGGPIEFGFDDYVGLGDYMVWRKKQGHDIPAAYSDYVTHVVEKDTVKPEESRPAFLADNAIRLIDKYQDDDAPFFLRLDFHGPHFPNVVPEPYFSMYDPKTLPQWPNNADPLTDKPAVQRIKQKHWKTEGKDWDWWSELVAAYYGEITLIDNEVGRVLDRLEALGIDEDTLVIWTTDHGDTIGAHGICNKDFTMYEEIYRVPMIAKWPNVIEPNSRSNDYVHHFIDICGTVMEIAGQETQQPFHGRSLMPIFKGETPENWPDSSFCEFHGSHMGLYSMRLLTTDDWAYIYHTNDIDELYNRKDDPWQLTNLAVDPAYAEVLEGLKRKMVRWMAETNDHLHNEWTVEWLTSDPNLAMEAPGRKKVDW